MGILCRHTCNRLYHTRCCVWRTLYDVHFTSYNCSSYTMYDLNRSTTYYENCMTYIVSRTVKCITYIVLHTLMYEQLYEQLFVIHSTWYIIHCTVYTVHCTLYTVYCTVYNVHCTVYNEHCTVDITCRSVNDVYIVYDIIHTFFFKYYRRSSHTV